MRRILVAMMLGSCGSCDGRAAGVNESVQREVQALEGAAASRRPRAGLLLPFGDGVDALPAESTEVLFVGPDGLGFAGVEVASAPTQEEWVRLGAALAAAYERRVPEAPRFPIAVAEAPRLPILAMVDRRVPAATLVTAVQLAAHSGFADIDLAVVTATEPEHLRVVRVASAVHERPPTFGVHLNAEDATVRCERAVTRVTDEDTLRATIRGCEWKGLVPLVITAAPGVPTSRLMAAMRVQTLEMAAPLEPWSGREQPRDDPSRIKVVVRAEDLVVTCHDEAREVADASLARDVARCAGSESGWIDLQAEEGVPVQRIVDMAAAGRRAGKRIGLEPSPR